MENYTMEDLIKNGGFRNEYEKYLKSLDKRKIPSKTKKRKEQNEDKKNVIIKYSFIPFSIFRYILSMLLVVVKLGLLTYLPINPLVNVSWIWIFLPAFCLEVAAFSIAIIIILIVTVSMGIYFGMIGLTSLWRKISKWWKMKQNKRAEQLIRDLEKN